MKMFPTTPWSVLLLAAACSVFGMSLALGSWSLRDNNFDGLCLVTEQDLEVIFKHGITKTDVNKFKVNLFSTSSVFFCLTVWELVLSNTLTHAVLFSGGWILYHR